MNDTLQLFIIIFGWPCKGFVVFLNLFGDHCLLFYLFLGICIDAASPYGIFSTASGAIDLPSGDCFLFGFLFDGIDCSKFEVPHFWMAKIIHPLGMLVDPSVLVKGLVGTFADFLIWGDLHFCGIGSEFLKSFFLDLSFFGNDRDGIVVFDCSR